MELEEQSEQALLNSELEDNALPEKKVTQYHIIYLHK